MWGVDGWGLAETCIKGLAGKTRDLQERPIFATFLFQHLHIPLADDLEIEYYPVADDNSGAGLWSSVAAS